VRRPGPAVRVEPSHGAEFRLHAGGEAGEVLDRDLVEELLAVGLELPARPGSGEECREEVAALSLNGDAAFFVGAYELDVRDALEMIARGLGEALRVYIARINESPPSAEPSTAHAEATEGERVQGRVRAPIKVSLADAQRDLELLVAQVQDGARVQITTERGAVVLMAWGEWAALQEKRAQLEVAWWSAMRTGELEARQYAADVSRVVGDAEAPHA